MKRIKDEELYREFLEGDAAVFDELMIRYGDSLTFYMYGITHDWQDAEDLVIEAFARIMVKRPNIREGAFKAYLFKTGRNLALNVVRKRNNRKTFSMEDVNTDPEAEEYIEEHLLKQEQQEALYMCLERIDPALREALWLIYFEDMSYKQAAQVMKVNAKKIDHMLSKAKKEMKAELKKEGVEGWCTNDRDH